MSIVIDIEYLNNLYRNIWWNSSKDLDLNFEVRSLWGKKKKEKEFEEIINQFITYISIFPKETEYREQWKKEVNNFIDDIILKKDIFKLGILDAKMKTQFFKATGEFIRQCKKFDDKLNYADIGQALRNVWIVYIFQKALGFDIEFSNAIFGYSMLYPYTDNYLDDITVPMNQKKTFNCNFSKKLQGDYIHPVNSHEEKVFKLVDYIESVFDRTQYPEVYEALLLIHEGQKKSLKQQDCISIPYERDILGISLEKGGASVLVDGYLISGKLTRDEEIFAYGYGFLLQLCDDLQDVKNDLQNHHMTIMSQLAGKYPLDLITNKLINLTHTVVKDAKCFKGNNVDELKDLIITNCLNLILFAIAEGRTYYSKEYIKKISQFLPFTLSYIKKLKSNLQKKFKVLKPQYNGVTLEDIILYLIE